MKRTDDTPISELSEEQARALDSEIRDSPIGRLMAHVGEAKREAEALFNLIEGQGFTKVRAHIEAHPPSVDCVALLAYVARDQLNAELRGQRQAGAEKANAKKKAAREWIVDEWQRRRAAYRDNKSEFARDYVPKLQGRFGVKVAHKTVTDRWLSR